MVWDGLQPSTRVANKSLRDLKHACVNFILSRSEQYYGLIPPLRSYMKLLKKAQYLPSVLLWVRMIKPKKKKALTIKILKGVQNQKLVLVVICSLERRRRSSCFLGVPVPLLLGYSRAVWRPRAIGRYGLLWEAVSWWRCRLDSWVAQKLLRILSAMCPHTNSLNAISPYCPRCVRL